MNHAAAGRIHRLIQSETMTTYDLQRRLTMKRMDVLECLDFLDKQGLLNPPELKKRWHGKVVRAWSAKPMA